MVQFANSFQIAVKEDGTQVILSFSQDIPVINEKEESHPERVADLIIPGELARELAQNILDFYPEKEV